MVVVTTEKGDPRTPIPARVITCNNVVSRGAPIGVFRHFIDHTHRNECKQNGPMIFLCFMCVYPQVQTAVHTHLMNHGHFHGGKNLNAPIGAPCWDKDGIGSGISGLYLWWWHRCFFTGNKMSQKSEPKCQIHGSLLWRYCWDTVFGVVLFKNCFMNPYWNE